MNISDYSKDAIEARQSGHDVKTYTRHTDYGVTEIYYHINITNTLAFIGGILIIPGLFWIADNLFNDGELCSFSETKYFDVVSIYLANKKNVPLVVKPGNKELEDFYKNNENSCFNFNNLRNIC